MAEIRGRVIRKPYAVGSKSEHEAVMLQTETDGDVLLRRVGGNAFHDEVLEGLVGRELQFQGELRGNTFFIRDWTAPKSRKK
jgi:hypothetical protein